jgi:hypothetical protein
MALLKTRMRHYIVGSMAHGLKPRGNLIEFSLSIEKLMSKERSS